MGSKGKHKVKGYQVEDLEDGECTEPASSGLSGSQQLNPSQTRRETLDNTRKDGKYSNNTQRSGKVLKHLHSDRKGKDKFTKTKQRQRSACHCQRHWRNFETRLEKRMTKLTS